MFTGGSGLQSVVGFRSFLDVGSKYVSVFLIKTVLDLIESSSKKCQFRGLLSCRVGCGIKVGTLRDSSIK